MSSTGPDPAPRAAARALSLWGCGPLGCLGTLVIVALALVAAFGLEWGFRIIFDPWSVPLGGRPTLTGEWVGTLRTASAMHFGLVLRIEYDELSESRIRIDGSGQLCNRRGEYYDYTLSGRPLDWSGANSTLTMGSVSACRASWWSGRARWSSRSCSRTPRARRCGSRCAHGSRASHDSRAGDRAELPQALISSRLTW